jgi:tetracycline repressor-like protein
MRRVIDHAITEGRIRADVDKEWVVNLLVAPIISAALTHQDALPKRQIEFIVDTVLAGLRREE